MWVGSQQGCGRGNGLSLRATPIGRPSPLALRTKRLNRVREAPQIECRYHGLNGVKPKSIVSRSSISTNVVGSAGKEQRLSVRRPTSHNLEGLLLVEANCHRRLLMQTDLLPGNRSNRAVRIG